LAFFAKPFLLFVVSDNADDLTADGANCADREIISSFGFMFLQIFSCLSC
jgi:hypothetical protein